MDNRPLIPVEYFDTLWSSIEPIQGEDWKDVVTPRGLTREYQVSTMGRVISLPRLRKTRNVGHFSIWRGRLLKPSPQRSGHLRVSILYDGKPFSTHVHRLVMWAFEGPQARGIHILHIDGDPGNNQLINLEYGTPWENRVDDFRHGKLGTGIIIGSSLMRRIESALTGTHDPMSILSDIKGLVLRSRSKSEL